MTVLTKCWQGIPPIGRTRNKMYQKGYQGRDVQGIRGRRGNALPDPGLPDGTGALQQVGSSSKWTERLERPGAVGPGSLCFAPHPHGQAKRWWREHQQWGVCMRFFF